LSTNKRVSIMETRSWRLERAAPFWEARDSAELSQGSTESPTGRSRPPGALRTAQRSVPTHIKRASLFTHFRLPHRRVSAPARLVCSEWGVAGKITHDEIDARSQPLPFMHTVDFGCANKSVLWF
jgi:hypothetical protein